MHLNLGGKQGKGNKLWKAIWNRTRNVLLCQNYVEGEKLWSIYGVLCKTMINMQIRHLSLIDIISRENLESRDN